MEYCFFCMREYGEEDMVNDGVCDKCMEKLLKIEDEAHDIYDAQDHKCFKCGIKLGSWMIEEIDGIKRAVCFKN